MKWRILTEEEERVKRQEVVVDSVKGHVDHANNRTRRMADNHHPLTLALMNCHPFEGSWTIKPITTMK